MIFYKKSVGFLLAIFFLSFLSFLSCSAQTAELTKVIPMPDFVGIEKWINTEPLSKTNLKGKVVLVDFWTYTCINCLRTVPHLVDWHNKYKDQGLVIVGIESPEFSFEGEIQNVEKAIDKLKIPYPVGVDSQMKTWDAFGNNVWPAHYLVDSKGTIRRVFLGEGDYEIQEKLIQQLLREKTPADSEKLKNMGTSSVPLPDFSQIHSPETYLGAARRQGLVTPDKNLSLNEWTYEGKWKDSIDFIELSAPHGKIRYHFKSNKVNLVVHPGSLPAKMSVRLDGQVVKDNQAGSDVKSGNVEVGEPRLYQLINLGPKEEEHIVEIEFLTPGIQAYAFTFG